MANYGEQHLLIPIIIALGKKREPMTTEELQSALKEMLQPWGDDLHSYTGRTDIAFSQTVRNFTADERMNDFKKIFVSKENGKLSLTNLGQKIFDSIIAPNKNKINKHYKAEYPIQVIYYGAPGTGKSYCIADKYELKPDNTFRTTFHPDTDYASFVGCYKPKSLNAKGITDEGNLSREQLIEKLNEYLTQGKQDKTFQYNTLTKFGYDFYYSLESNFNNIKSIIKEVLNKENDNFSDDVYVKAGMAMYEKIGMQSKQEISYRFTEQTFTNAYVKAWKNYCSWSVVQNNETDQTNSEDKGPEPVFLIIDEINRGNCAQIFGDIFQLLDRNDDGFSDYEIQPDSDLQNCISQKGINAKGILNQKGEDISSKINDGSLLKFPPNLCLIATMNTSDQSLFPMDSAFKRRWDWEFVRIDYAEATKIWVKISDTEYYNWGELTKAINNQVKLATSSADKQIGNWFVKAKDNKITLKQLVNKVIFYLWNDVYKDFDKDDEGYIFESIDSFESFFEPASDDPNGSGFTDGINLNHVHKFIDGLDGVNKYSEPKMDSIEKEENEQEVND